MGTQSQKGFTIIEVIVVLAITGLMIIGLLTGIGATVNNQRYNDAVQTLKADIQSQYSEISSVFNDRDNDERCGSGAQPVFEDDATAAQKRGQSDCVLVGRLMVISKTDMTTTSIAGYKLSEPSEAADDLTVLKTNYNLNNIPSMNDKKKLEWGTRIAWPKSGPGAVGSETARLNRSIAILFIRSPESGLVYTFTGQTIGSGSNQAELTPAEIKAMITTSAQASRVLCVDSVGLVTTANRAVYLQAAANGASSVETLTNDLLYDMRAPGGVAIQC